MSPRLIWILGAAITITVTAGLGVYLVMVGLDNADKIASVVSAFVAIASLAVTVAAWRRSSAAPAKRPSPGTPPPPDSQPSPGTTVSNTITGQAGPVVQAGTVNGGVVFGSTSPGVPPHTPPDEDGDAPADRL